MWDVLFYPIDLEPGHVTLFGQWKIRRLDMSKELKCTSVGEH
jgi:hypothetical protein